MIGNGANLKSVEEPDSTRNRRLCAAGTLVLAAMMCVRISLTYSVFTQTYDEPIHIACGMEWLDRGSYHYEALHPPLGRVAAAIGPYLAGERSHGLRTPDAEGNLILGDAAHYWRNLSLARLGELPFSLLALTGIWMWTVRYLGASAAFFSCFVFSMLPPILAHGGLATTDIAVTAGCVWALYAFVRFLEHRSWQTSLSLGFWCAIAMLSKLSSIPFLTCAFTAIFAVYIFRPRKGQERALKDMSLVPAIVIVLTVSFLVVWGGYRFSTQPLFASDGPHFESADVPRALVRPVVRTMLTTFPIPAGQFIRGVGQVWLHNRSRHWNYLLGQLKETSWWYFFPVVLSIKTPLGFLVLSLFGAGLLLVRLRTGEWQAAAPVVAAFSILLVCVASRINLGVRHILPIYPLLSIGAGNFVAVSLRPFRNARSIFALSLLLWCSVDSLLAHPDYLAWFNPIASNHPEQFRVDSDLDWGQDFGRLSKRLQALHVSSIEMPSLFSAGEALRIGLPPVHEIPCDAPMNGYVAVSFNMLYVDGPLSRCPARFLQLREIRPTERVGKSILLYYFPEE